MTTTHRQVDQVKVQALVVPIQKSHAGDAPPLQRLPSVRDRNFRVSLSVLSVLSFTRKPLPQAREIEGIILPGFV